jgi:integrase
MSGTKNHRGWGWIRKRNSGRYEASYIGPDNRRHHAPGTFQNKMQAEAWLARERQDIDNARDAALRCGGRLEWMSPAERIAAATEVSRETLHDYGKRWIAQRDIKPRSRIHYEAILERHIAPKLGSIAVTNLRPVMIRDWYAATLRDKPTMRSHAYQLLHAICKTAVADELLSVNPCQIEGATATKRSRELTVPDIAQLAVIADKIDAKYKALVLISAWCGLRFGEVIELRRKDFEYTEDSDEPVAVNVSRGVTHRSDGTGTRCRIDTPKSGKGRKVAIPPHIRADVQNHLDSFTDIEADSLLFKPIRGGCHVSDRVVRAAFVPACQAAGLTGVRLHALRHFQGHQAARVGNLAEVMRRMGHSTQQAALIYSGVVSGRDAEMAVALSELAKQAKP